jgi:hypothetical protein
MPINVLGLNSVEFAFRSVTLMYRKCSHCFQQTTIKVTIAQVKSAVSTVDEVCDHEH